MPNQWILAITTILSVLVLIGSNLSNSGYSADLFTGIVSVVIFSAAMFGLFRFIVGIIHTIKNPAPPRVEGRWEDNFDGSVGYGDSNSDWGDFASHGSGDFGVSDGGSACDSGGSDGGGCHGE